MADQSAGIRIIKKKKITGGHHGGAWKVAYADFVTAMMAFFLVMWIVGLSSNIKQAIAGYFKDPVKFMSEVNSGHSPFSLAAMEGTGSKEGTGGKLDKPSAQDAPAVAEERARLKQAKETIQKIIAATPEFSDLKKYVDVKLVDEGLKVDLVEAKESLFFDAASAKIKPSTAHLLAQMAKELGRLPNKVIIEGHTDSRPLARTDGYTNWELSADRANSARRVMEGKGLHTRQVAQVRGYAATLPRDAEHPEHFSNRRVSIVVVMKGALVRENGGPIAENIAVPTFGK